MTVDEVKKAAADLAMQMTELARAFETTTGTVIHSIPVDRVNNVVNVRVKVQIG